VKIYRSLDEFKTLPFAVVTTGTFDGVHVGHQIIIKDVVSYAKQLGGESVLVTFFPHPRVVLQPESDLQLLTSIDERIELLKHTGLDHLLIIPFNKEFSRTSSLSFVRDILVNKIGTKKLIIGYDHHFGRNREGSFEHLLEFGPVYGFEVKEIAAQDVDNMKVSSTQIRKALLEGNTQKASTLLGYPYFFNGTVVEGKQIGRQLGYPTANIFWDEKRKLIPKHGVYLGRLFFKDNPAQFKYGMLNIGMKPTVGGTNLSIEIHLFDFEKDIYNKEVKLELLDKIRDEYSFEGLEALKNQIDKDKETCLKLISQYYSSAGV
jgi:riboflavin kinase/FMN adenylyltransferase